MVRNAELNRQRCREYYHTNREKQLARSRRYYYNNLEREQERCRKSSAQYNIRKKEVLIELRAGGCKKCGERDPVVLEFHHVDPDQKKFCVGDGRPRSEKSVREEAAKCIVLCANCHRRLEWQLKQERKND